MYLLFVSFFTKKTEEFYLTKQPNFFKNGAKYHRETRLERIRLHVLFVAWI